MKMLFVLLIIQNLFLHREIQGLELNSLIDVCDAKDPKLNECVKEAAQKFIFYMGKGISEWNIPPLDPLTTPLVVLKIPNDEDTLEVEYRNVIQQGLSSAIFENVNEIDLDRGIISFKLRYPCTTFLSDYAAEGKMLGFEFKGQGKGNTTTWNVLNDFEINYRVEADHVKLNSINSTIYFDKIYLDYPNLMINGDEELSKSAHSFLNDNASEIMAGMKPQMEEFYRKMMKEVLQKFFDSVPYSALFKNA